LIDSDCEHSKLCAPQMPCYLARGPFIPSRRLTARQRTFCDCPGTCGRDQRPPVTSGVIQRQRPENFPTCHSPSYRVSAYPSTSANQNILFKPHMPTQRQSLMLKTIPVKPCHRVHANVRPVSRRCISNRQRSRADTDIRIFRSMRVQVVLVHFGSSLVSGPVLAGPVGGPWGGSECCCIIG
jgi:hypothetical protein